MPVAPPRRLACKVAPSYVKVNRSLLVTGLDAWGPLCLHLRRCWPGASEHGLLNESHNQIMKARTTFSPLNAFNAVNPFSAFALLLLAAALAYGSEESAWKLVVPDGKGYTGKKITAKVFNSGFALGHDSYNAMGIGRDGKLYFATHVGVYSIVEGKETMGIPPAGYKPYPGGHLLSYDLKSSKFEDYGIAPGREGVLTFNMDTKRGRLFAITWPSGIFYRYNLATKDQKEFGKMCAKGEDGVGADYRTVCRSIVVNQEDGTAYFT